MIFTDDFGQQEYIFPRSRKVSPRDGTEVKTCFICREKVSFSAVVEKKDSCLTECYPSEARVDSTGKLDSEAKLDSPSEWRPRKRKPSQGKGNGLIVRFPSWGNTLLARGCIFFLERASLKIS